MVSQSHYLRNHDEIRRWVEERGGKPATVESTERGEAAGILRIDFPGYGEEERLEHISWDDWFAKFDERDLVMVVQDGAGGSISRFNKLVARPSAGDPGESSDDAN